MSTLIFLTAIYIFFLTRRKVHISGRAGKMAQTLIFQVFSVAGHLVRYIRKQATKKNGFIFTKKQNSYSYWKI